MPNGLTAERQVADVVLADLQRELPLLRQGKEVLRLGKDALGQMRRDAMIGDDQKPGVLAGARDGGRERCERARLAGEVGADIENRDAVVVSIMSGIVRLRPHPPSPDGLGPSLSHDAGEGLSPTPRSGRDR